MLRVRTSFTGVQGSPWLSTMYFDDVGGTESAQECVNAVGAFWGAADALMGGSVQWTTEAEVATVDPATGDVTSVASTTPVTGAGTASELGPLAMQGLVRWRTGSFVGGREVRGRSFIPGLTESQNASGSLATAAQTTLQTAAAALIADPLCILTVWSRKNGVARAVASSSVWSQFAVLRSRRD